MPWAPEEQHDKEALRPFLLGAQLSIAGVTLLSTRLIWDVRGPVRDGERTVAAVKSAYETMAAGSQAFLLSAVRQWRRVWCAVAGLVWIAMHAAALLALPAAG